MPNNLSTMLNSEYSIEPCDKPLDLANTNRYVKLSMPIEHRTQIMALAQQMPSLIASESMANMYVVKFPDGIPHALTPLKQGGYSTMVHGETGRIVGSASLYDAGSKLALLNAFTAMSIATGQFFLTEINTKMEKMSLSIDKILEFLYGDKRAELLSEVSFVKYANDNYSSIMTSESQRIATISSLQTAKKIAIKDMEFYLSDLETKKNTVDKSYPKFCEACADAIRITNCLDLSAQLYALSCIMEVYYSQNTNPTYLGYVSEEADYYLQKCDKAKLSCFSSLHTKNQAQYFTSLPTKKIDTAPLDEKIMTILNPLNEQNRNPLVELVKKAFDQTNTESELYMTANGDLYASKAS